MRGQLRIDMYRDERSRGEIRAEREKEGEQCVREGKD